MPLVGFEPIISAGERPNTYALDRAATGNGHILCVKSGIVTLINLLVLLCGKPNVSRVQVLSPLLRIAVILIRKLITLT